MSEELINLSFMEDISDTTATTTKQPAILAFYDKVKRAGLCLCTIGWRGEGKNQQRIYCFKPVTQVWFVYCHSEQEWYAINPTCENHTEYDIIGIRDREKYPEDPHNHAISAPWPYCGDYSDKRLRNARLDDIPTTYPHDARANHRRMAGGETRR